MAEQAYDRTNTGALFKNESDNEKAPQLSGPLNIDGKEYRIAAWLKEGQKGKFYSLKATPADEFKTKSLPGRRPDAAGWTAPAAKKDELGDIPF
jgi:hypothetical protein